MQSKVCIIFLLFLASCVSHGTKEALDKAEAILSVAPDSAFAIVERIPREALTTPSLRARHALLLTQTQDKCYIDIAKDSTILVAYKWYQNHGTDFDRLRATYYLGVVQQNAGNDVQAAILFSEVEPLAEKLKEYRWQSLCNQHISAIFSRNYDWVRAMDSAQKSVSEAEQAKDSLMADYCRLDMAAQYIAQNKFDAAEALLTRIIKEYEENTALYSYASRLLAKIFLLLQNPEYEKAGNLYDIIIENNAIDLSCQDYVHLGLIAQYRGNISLSEFYCRRAEEMMRTPVDSTTFYTILSNLYSLKGEKKKSNEVFNMAMMIQDRIVYAQLEQSITHALENYYQNQTDLEKAKGRSRLSFFLLIGVLLIGVIIWLTARLRQARREIVEKMAQIQDFSSDLESLQSKDSASQVLLDYYTKDKVKSLNSLANAYFLWDSDTVRQKEKQVGNHTKEELVDLFQRQLEGFRKNDGFYSSLEKALNVAHDNIMIRAREALKKEKVDYDLVALFFWGFSAKSICFLKDMSEASVRMRKTRLKQFFAALPDHLGDEFVSILERKY